MKLRNFAETALIHLTLIGASLIMLFPIIYVLLGSFKGPTEMFSLHPKLLPQGLYLQNYVDAWQLNPFGNFIVNSILVATAITLGQMLTSVLGAYAFARLRFAGRDALFMVYLATLMIPGHVTLIPTFLIVKSLGWVDTYAGLTVPFLATAFGTFLMRQFFLTIPGELEDAAKIDGAGRLRFLFQILLPLSRPALGALGIWSFLSAWNQYLWPLIVTNSTKMRTVQIGIAMFLREEEGTSWAVVMAGTMLVILPTLIAFLAAQKQIIKGIAVTGMKG
jgi:ABC-type glycerol-3-phosphate transport system permease component